jgi:hypothetical protein
MKSSKNSIHDYVAPSFNQVQTVAQPVIPHVRFNRNETAVGFFTPYIEPVVLHFNEDYGHYVQCNGDVCYSCQSGKGKVEKILHPVFLPQTNSFGVLAISTDDRPKALLPQIKNSVAHGKTTLAFITREQGDFFSVTQGQAENGLNLDQSRIDQLLAQIDSGSVVLSDLYPKVSNEELAQSPEVVRMLELKGYSLIANRPEVSPEPVYEPSLDDLAAEEQMRDEQMLAQQMQDQDGNES